MKKPFYILAKFKSKCKMCEKILLKGETIFWYPDHKEVYCVDCTMKYCTEIDKENNKVENGT